MPKVVCVTGANGFIASWVVCKLLEKGYTVHGTVRDPENGDKCGHLKSLQGAEERLILFKADVLDYDSLVPAIRGCDAVIHTACPLFSRFDTMEEVVDPAVKGTRNVLDICSKDKKIKRVVMTSSTAAVLFDVNRPRDQVVDESCWSDLDFCKETKLWYLVAKTESEKIAWELAKQHNLDLCVICPTFTFGPLLQPTLNMSVDYLKKLVDGSSNSYPETHIQVVDVRDVAKAHVLAMEKESASGRYVCVERTVSHEDLLNTLRSAFPELSYPNESSEDAFLKNIWPPPHLISNAKVKDLIEEFIPYEQTLVETVSSLKDKRLL